MIKKVITNKTSIRRIETREGETIETKVRRVMSNNEPIHDEAPLIYTERKEGVNPDYDIRSDRFDFALLMSTIAGLILNLRIKINKNSQTGVYQFFMEFSKQVKEDPELIDNVQKVLEESKQKTNEQTSK